VSLADDFIGLVWRKNPRLRDADRLSMSTAEYERSLRLAVEFGERETLAKLKAKDDALLPEGFEALFGKFK
jgi:hypothetical protein